MTRVDIRSLRNGPNVTGVESMTISENIQTTNSTSATLPIRILGIAGSLRAESFNKRLLQAATKLLPPYTELEISDLQGIPLYNQDIEAVAFPQAAVLLKHKIEDADAVLFSTPEYNHSYPGVLKNAVDWVSRPFGQNSLDGKPTAVISASPSLFGGVAAQDQLKQVLLNLNTRLVTRPAVIVTLAEQKFDQNGNLIDPNARQFLQQLITNLAESARRLSQLDQTFVAPALRPMITNNQGRKR